MSTTPTTTDTVTVTRASDGKYTASSAVFPGSYGWGDTETLALSAFADLLIEELQFMAGAGR